MSEQPGPFGAAHAEAAAGEADQLSPPPERPAPPARSESRPKPELSPLGNGVPPVPSYGRFTRFG